MYVRHIYNFAYYISNLYIWFCNYIMFYMIPSKSNTEWKALFEGENNLKLTSFSLQMKLNALKLDYRLQRISLERAIDDFINMLKRNEKQYENDIKIIFNS